MLVLELERRHLLRPAPINHLHLAGAQPHRSIGCIDGCVACADDGNLRRHNRNLAALVACNKIQRVGHAFQLLSGNAQLVNCPQPNTEKDRVILRFDLRQLLRIYYRVEVERHAELRQHINLAQALLQGQLVLRDAIGVQSAGQRTRIKDLGADSTPSQLRSARQRRRPTADERHLLAGILPRSKRQRRPARMQRIHGKALQASNLDWLLVVAVHHARAFAQHIHRASSRTTSTQDVRIQNRLRRALKIAARNLLDELRHINMRWTGRHARRVEAVKTSIRLGHRSRPLKWRMQVRKARRNFG